ncbi:MAG: DUF480 domain-containing protein [Ignavibacteria bacterium]|nr:DUF480 domain-containing protein [Ignavibacteria bacterium]
MILNAKEIRVLGSLIEKEITTPEYYPLTLNSLVTACNQKSCREPVTQLSASEISAVVDDLHEKQLITKVTGAEIRNVKFKQKLTAVLNISREQIAVLCELMLRGPQTPGELRSRASRMHPFENAEQMENLLLSLAQAFPEPLVVKLPRQPGKDARYIHLLSGQPEFQEELPVVSIKTDHDRIQELETEIAALKSEMQSLRDELTAFRNQFQ